ncbi:MAG TPA: serine/threonine-protein kinase, partial [Minicystis sp.]|nr:serine/threonine-protein kinase [Minicystis sp.]
MPPGAAGAQDLARRGLPAIGDVVAGKYRVDEIVGEGGMGVVLGATHLELGRRVALKFLSPAAAPSSDAVPRFLREARAMAALEGEHVARVIDVGALPTGAPYIVMERLVGVDLERELARRGRFPVAEAVDSVLQACEALAEAHAAGIVHRDLKPSNLFRAMRPPGEPIVKVLDFGISKLAAGAQPAAAGVTTTGGGPIGSPRYMSPEQIRGHGVDRRTDVWALGVVLFELLAARSPLAADSFPALYAAI